MACMSRGGMMMEEPTRNPSNVGVNARGSHTVNHGYMPGHTAVDALFKDKMNANTNTKHFPSGMYFQNWGKEEIGPKTLCSSNMESDSRLETDIDGVWAILNSLKNFDVEDAVMVVKYSKKGTKVRIVRGQTDDFMLDTLGKESMMPFGNDGSTSNPLFYDALATNSVEGVRSTTDMMATGRTQQGSTQMNRGSHNQDNSFGLQVSFDQPGSQQRTSSGGFEQVSEKFRGNYSGQHGEYDQEVEAVANLTYRKPFPASSELQDHKPQDHNTTSTTNTGEKSSERFSCPRCNATFRYNSYLIKHMTARTCEKPFRCTICGKGFMYRSLLTTHMTTHSDLRPFECNQCKKTFSRSQGLQRHLISHLTGKSFNCEKCEEKFISLSSLNNHIIALHTDVPSFECSICGKLFYKRSSLTHHKRSHHEDGKKHLCSKCGMVLSTKGSLRRHVKLHMGHKYFKCPICGKAFYDNLQLAHHQSGHTSKEASECSTCGKTFSYKSHLDNHIKEGICQKITCTTCGRKFSPSELSIHLGTDSLSESSKAFACTMCGKFFSTKCKVQRHMAIHTGKNSNHLE